MHAQGQLEQTFLRPMHVIEAPVSQCARPARISRVSARHSHSSARDKVQEGLKRQTSSVTRTKNAERRAPSSAEIRKLGSSLTAYHSEITCVSSSTYITGAYAGRGELARYIQLPLTYTGDFCLHTARNARTCSRLITDACGRTSYARIRKSVPDGHVADLLVTSIHTV